VLRAVERWDVKITTGAKARIGMSTVQRKWASVVFFHPSREFNDPPCLCFAAFQYGAHHGATEEDWPFFYAWRSLSIHAPSFCC